MTATRLRLVTLNLWGTEPPLGRRLALAGRQLAALDPDVIALQEVKPHGDATTAHALAAARGDHVLYLPALRWADGAFGLQRMGTNLGWAMGPALGGLLSWVVPYGAVFFLAAAGMLIAAWLWNRIKPALPILAEISVSETPASRCVVRG